jgi:hypothetical protein
MVTRRYGGLRSLGLSLNFTVCGNTLKSFGPLKLNCLLGKIQRIRQSAGNQTLFYSNGVGSSETIRETLSNIDTNLLNLDLKFKHWFIGFAEGDCSFMVSKLGYLEFKIIQSSVSAQILFYIKENLGFGSVSKQYKTSNTHYFRVRDQKNIFKLIYIFNGNLLTEEKNNQFKLWVEAYNKVYNASIVLIKKSESPTFHNGWLSGFSDAEGCFTVSVIKRSQMYNQVQIRYVLSQNYEFELLNRIAQMFMGKISYLKGYHGYSMTVNLSKLSKVIYYFTKYPLKTKKKIDYSAWLKVYKLVANKDHMTENGLSRIKNLINKINKRS